MILMVICNSMLNLFFFSFGFRFKFNKFSYLYKMLILFIVEFFEWWIFYDSFDFIYVIFV